MWSALPWVDLRGERRSMSNKWVFLAVVAVTVIVVDQWTKFLTLEHLSTAFEGASSRVGVFVGNAPAQGFDGYHYRPTAPVVLSDSFFRFRYAENPGAAFGLFRTLPENLRGPLFHVVSLGAVALILYYWRQLTGAKVERWAKWGLPLVFGGAIGNYLDRLARGFVIDFIEAHWFEKAYWPAFNIADSAIVVGVGLLVIDSFVRKETKVVKPAAA
jgi:signal peptidase II